MNLFSDDHDNRRNLLSLAVIFFLLISISLTVHVVQLQQELRQQATNSCRVENAECNVNQSDKSCCTGLQCSIKNVKNGNGKCEPVTTSIPPTPTPYVYVVPTSYSEDPGVTPGLGGNNVSNPDPVQCGPNGCGWSPRPEGENSTTHPGIQVCTMSFNGPSQLIGTRLSSTSMQFNWWPTPGGADKQFIQYGLEPGKPQWGLINIAGDAGQIVINDLPANKLIWAQVRAYKGNCYEDTGWVSVAAFNQAAYGTPVPLQTIVPTTDTVYPTAVSAFNSGPTVTPQPESYFLSEDFFKSNNAIFFVIVIVTTFGILFFPVFRKRNRKKEH